MDLPSCGPAVGNAGRRQFFQAAPPYPRVSKANVEGVLIHYRAERIVYDPFTGLRRLESYIGAMSAADWHTRSKDGWTYIETARERLGERPTPS